MEEQVTKLTGDLKKLQEIGEIEKQTNVQLEIQIKELKEKLSGKIVQNELQSNIEIEELNKKIKELQEKLSNVEKVYQEKLEDCKKQQGELNNCFV